MRAFLAFATALLSLTLFAQGSLAQYQEGEHYTKLAVPLKASSKKIQVEEFFAYSCPHCRTFEAQVTGWKPSLAKDVKFMPTPVAWQLVEEGERGHEMVVMAKAYYLGKYLKVLNKTHPAMFQAVITERKSLKNAADLWPIFKAAGADKAKFNKLYAAFGIGSKVKVAHSRQLGAKISSTPEMIVDGRYSVKPESGLDVLKVVDFLIKKIRLERAALAQGFKSEHVGGGGGSGKSAAMGEHVGGGGGSGKSAAMGEHVGGGGGSGKSVAMGEHVGGGGGSGKSAAMGEHVGGGGGSGKSAAEANPE